MSICVIHPVVSKESAEYLADNIGAAITNPFKADKRDFREYDVVFNYGCNREIYAKKVINKQKSVAVCIDKVATYKVFKAAGVATVDFVTRKQDIPKSWATVVVRPDAKGSQAKDLDYGYQSLGEAIPDGGLFTEYFQHVNEYRIVVFMGKVVGRYYKEKQPNNTWKFVLCTKAGFKDIDNSALRASEALQIDYVGFDVLEDQEGSYRFLEANTGPIMTDESLKAIKKYFKSL